MWRPRPAKSFAAPASLVFPVRVVIVTSDIVAPRQVGETGHGAIVAPGRASSVALLVERLLVILMVTHRTQVVLYDMWMVALNR